MTTVEEVATPLGLARLHVDRNRQRLTARATVVLGHGAGGGVDSPDLKMLATELPSHGFQVIRVEQPWRVSGRRVSSGPATLDVAWDHCLGVITEWTDTKRLVLGGRSAGARVAFRSVARPTGVPALGILALSFPLHPPGRPERSRRAELDASVPSLIVQGERDALGAPAEFGTLPDSVTLKVVPGADHQLRVGRGGLLTPTEIGQLVLDRCREWLSDLTCRESTTVGER